MLNFVKKKAQNFFVYVVDTGLEGADDTCSQSSLEVLPMESETSSSDVLLSTDDFSKLSVELDAVLDESWDDSDDSEFRFDLETVQFSSLTSSTSKRPVPSLSRSEFQSSASQYSKTSVASTTSFRYLFTVLWSAGTTCDLNTPVIHTFMYFFSHSYSLRFSIVSTTSLRKKHLTD